MSISPRSQITTGAKLISYFKILLLQIHCVKLWVYYISFKSFLITIIYVMSICGGWHTSHKACVAVRGELCGVSLFFTCIWVWGTKLRPPSLSGFICWVIFLAFSTFLWNNYFICVYVPDVCMSLDTRRECLIPEKRSYRQLWAVWSECWELRFSSRAASALNCCSLFLAPHYILYRDKLYFPYSHLSIPFLILFSSFSSHMYSDGSVELGFGTWATLWPETFLAVWDETCYSTSVSLA